MSKSFRPSFYALPMLAMLVAGLLVFSTPAQAGVYLIPPAKAQPTFTCSDCSKYVGNTSQLNQAVITTKAGTIYQPGDWAQIKLSHPHWPFVAQGNQVALSVTSDSTVGPNWSMCMGVGNCQPVKPGIQQVLPVPNAQSHVYLKLAFTDHKSHRSQPNVLHVLYSWQTVVTTPPSFTLTGNGSPLKAAYNATDMQGSGGLDVTIDNEHAPYGLSESSMTINGTVYQNVQDEILQNDGLYGVTATLADKAWPPNVATQTTQIIIDTSAPQVSLVTKTPIMSASSFQPTIVVSAQDVPLNGYASGISTTQAQLRVDGQPRDATLVANPDGTFSVTPNMPLTPGRHRFRVVVFDNAGNPSTGNDSGKILLGQAACQALSKPLKKVELAIKKTRRQIRKLASRLHHIHGRSHRANATRLRLFLKIARQSTRLASQRAQLKLIGAGCF